MIFCSVFREFLRIVYFWSICKSALYWKFIVNAVPVMIAVELNLFPFRTEKLKPLAPKILEEISGKIGRRRDSTHNIYIYSVSVNIFLIPIRSYPTP